MKKPSDLTGGADAQRLWEEARTMPHNYIPDFQADADYLQRVYDAAQMGHLEAMAKLGEYAFRRNSLVEAYYWAALAELKGATGVAALLRKVKANWLRRGCPAEREGLHDGFTEQQGSFARALLRIRCAVDAALARARMHELSDQGCEEAQLFLKLRNP